LTSAGEVIVVQCVTPHVEEIPVTGAAPGGAEPEVVGKKASDEEGAEAAKK